MQKAWGRSHQPAPAVAFVPPCLLQRRRCKSRAGRTLLLGLYTVGSGGTKKPRKSAPRKRPVINLHSDDQGGVVYGNPIPPVPCTVCRLKPVNPIPDRPLAFLFPSHLLFSRQLPPPGRLRFCLCLRQFGGAA